MSIQKPSEREEEYFARQEFERRKKALEDAQGRLAQAERQRLRELHYMRCPKCGAELVTVQYRGLEIDKCWSCAGVWLDCGELERVAGEEGFVRNLLSIFR